MPHLLNFPFAYPTERDEFPSWLITELAQRLEAQVTLPAPLSQRLPVPPVQPMGLYRGHH